jgi:hypothetical protein
MEKMEVRVKFVAGFYVDSVLAACCCFVFFCYAEMNERKRTAQKCEVEVELAIYTCFC